MSHNYSEFDADARSGTDLRIAVLGICLLACALFALTIFLDVQSHKGYIKYPSWLSIGDVDDARVMLVAIIGAVSTVLGLVFSVVLLVLSMASTQFGPRLLRRFIIEQNGQGTIGLFSSTFLFSLFTLVVVRYQDGHEFVPHLTTLTAVLMMILSFAALITFSQNIRKEIQTGNLIAKVDEDLTRVITNYVALRKARTKESANIAPEEHPEVLRKRSLNESYSVLASNPGYLQSINYSKLIKAATREDAVIILKVRPGHFVITETTLADIIPNEKGPILIKTIHETLRIGPNRTLPQDPEFAMAQIVEIGIRALGDAINDTFTGIACVDWLTNNISVLVDLPETGESWQDGAGRTRLIEMPVTFSHLVGAAFDMIRESGGKNPAILIRMLQNFTRIAPHLRSDKQRAAIMRQITAIREFVDLHPFTRTDMKDMIEIYDKACAALNIAI
ncbi:DUF2254 domain-containing protein [Legionella sp. PC997]|uniref:DUF2254 domain-containing protein n=1 Tax=Legionella sp. PC997 TaxID=2755562 RepID=UPI0015FC8682|nr:DUF2254 domain-containing protein [Legionella sp. PC997]QMT59503.1 hypothetical protein HBNCFIEN_00869 [Legionella sp. PC997]